MNRRFFLTRLGGCAALETIPALAADAEERGQTTSDGLPRKVIVGTVMQSFWGQYPGLPGAWSNSPGSLTKWPPRPGRLTDAGLDLAILPETAITGESGGDTVASSVAFEGEVRQAFTSKAREQNCYIVAPTYLLDSKEKRLCSNAAILVGRKGEVVGTYRKVHLVVSLERRTMEGGATPGETLPVFDCDFGKLGIQICYDMEFSSGLGRVGAPRGGADRLAHTIAADLPARIPVPSPPLLHRLQHLAAQRLDFRAHGQDCGADQAAAKHPGPRTGPQLRAAAVEFKAAQRRSPPASLW